MNIAGLDAVNKINIETVSGNIELDTLTASTLAVTSSAGNVDAIELTAASATFGIDSGNLAILSSHLTGLHVTMSAGNIELDDVFGTNLTIVDQSGNVITDSDGIDYATVAITTSAGNIDVLLNNLVAMDIESVSGNVAAEVASFAAAGTSTVTVTSGSVDLDVDKAALTNLYIDALADTGAVYNRIDFASENSSLTHLVGQNGTGENKINIHVTTGSIDIED
jgi:DUF4097 and DUF4098 domain-containing protein YvlB